MRFCLDTPTTTELGRATRFSGWYVSSDGRAANSICISADGSPTVRAAQVNRSDLSKAFPNLPYSASGGFVADLVLPDDVRGQITVTIEADGVRAYQSKFVVTRTQGNWPKRQRSYRIEDLLSKAPSSVIAGVPHFHAGALPTVRILDTGTSHPWSRTSRSLIADLKQGQVFLDLGCGIKSAADLPPNAILFDCIHYPHVDLVSVEPNIPLRDQSVDLVVSQAVFEHVPDPFHLAREIFRILKPGGIASIETAFMQPLHGDPDHYFNMTSGGLREIMRPFEDVTIGVRPWQTPMWGLIMQLEAIIPLMAYGTWRTRMEALLAELRRDGVNLDRDLGLVGREVIAAGVSAIGRKP